MSETYKSMTKDSPKRDRDSSSHPDCFICRKHSGKEDAPPGGYIFESKHFMLCHAPLELGPSGTLILESKRHILDFGEMRTEEGVELSEILRRVFPLMKKLSNAERIYSVAMMEGVPHFHLWLVPRKRNSRLRGLKYLAREQMAPKKTAEKIANQIHTSFL